jgi:enoyl-CoA hydratase/carnithine racemase
MIDRDEKSHLVVLRSEGRFFSAGADLKDLASITRLDSAISCGISSRFMPK